MDVGVGVGVVGREVGVEREPVPSVVGLPVDFLDLFALPRLFVEPFFLPLPSFGDAGTECEFE